MAGGEREWGRGVRYGVVPHGSEVGDGKGAPTDDMGGGARPTAARPRWVLGWCRSARNRGGGGRLTGGVGRHGADRCGSNGV
jgi:hypothetical protein